ncbi:MAG TPA: DUF6249 domain-containing protein [Candidatus Eisenbacteria bacterium]|nr:DUF6249 domain-containing protein [Candidatus Eisenbacteria bacterium]
MPVLILPLFTFEPEAFLPFLIFAIPIIAITGGLVIGIIKTMGQQRLVELAQRERIAAIERGIDPAKLPPVALPADTGGGPFLYANYRDYALKRTHGLMIGGIVTLFTGIGLSLMIWFVNSDHEGWPVGLIPVAVGIALLLSASLTRPRPEDSAPPMQAPRP